MTTCLRRSTLLRLPLLAAWVLAVGLTGVGLPVHAAEEGEGRAAVTVGEWLVAGPVALPRPAFSEETGALRTEPLEVAALLPEPPVEDGEPWPTAGAELPLPSGVGTWEPRSGSPLELAGEGAPRLAWIAFFVDAERFVKAEITATTGHLARVFVDGEMLAEKTSPDEGPQSGEEGGGENDGDSAAGTAKGEVALTTGKHRVLVAALRHPDGPAEWELGVTLSLDAEVRDAVAVSTSPRRGVTIPDLLDPPHLEAVDLSADGTLLAVTLQQPAIPAEDRTSWVEIVRAADGSPVRTLRLPTGISGFAWAPAGHAFAYRTGGEDGTTLWVGDLEGGELRPLLEDVERLSSHRWAADGRSLFVQISEDADADGDDRGARRVLSLPDRWAGLRDLGSIHQVSVEGGGLRRITAGPRTVSLEDVSPDGRSLLVSRTRYTLERPFVVGELAEIDLATLEPEAVTEVTWLRSAAYSPEGSRILITAGPSAFGGLGTALPEGTVPNEYDDQAYLLHRGSGEVEAITRDLDPAVRSAAWSHHDGSIYLLTTEGSRGPLYRYRPEEPPGERFQRLDAGPEVVSALAPARSAPTLAVTGSSLQAPEAAWVLASADAPGRAVVEPAQQVLAQVRFGRVEDFDHTTGDGTRIPGRLHYPVDFDPGRRYPLLVYYYGGVVPVTREYGGRYPVDLWTARGYAVYVLQPSGAVGWGQERSALHVNDWGERIVDEILAGVDAVVAAHPFLDGSRVGCLGGSYGGFTTMSLVTASDRFAAAVSHAGISGIASYWGEGWWGYLYMAAAAADSYPWNRPDLFVERSPLFRADEIDTPLLLLHGTSDPNVPIGESEQMFAALRLLGKEVEYVRIEGEAHWIQRYPKRVLWWNTILAWFDRHLKEQPAHWNELWGDNPGPAGP